MKDSRLRRELLALLGGAQAHVTPGRVFAGLAPALRDARPAPGGHSVWQLLEHMRIAQEDILRYTLDPAWESPEWPREYWPADGDRPTPARWGRSLAAFFSDLEEVKALVRDPARDLTARIPHGEGRTYLREALLVADHNAFHLGQVVLTRKLLGAWGG